MSKFLFTHSYFYRFDPKQWATAQPYAPLGTITAAAVMREAGHEVNLFDTNLAEDEKPLYSMLQAEKPNYLVVYDDGFNYLTKMCLTNMREAAFRMTDSARKAGCHVIVCSSDSTDHYDKYLDNGCDFVILGEGEQTLLELVAALDKGATDFEGIEGIAFRTENGATVRTKKRAILKELDTLPMAAWDLVNVEAYKTIWMQNHGYFSMNMATTRGCPFKCNWCAKPIYGNRYNTRSPQKVVDEIAFLIQNYGPTHFWMCDDIFGLKPGWVQEFGSLVRERALPFQYKIQSRVDLLLREDTIQALARSGAKTIWVGAESGSQKILDAMDKGTQVEQIYEATRLLKKNGIRVAFFLQFGYLNETKEDIRKTVKMVLDLLPDDIGISVSYPLPGTKFYEKVKTELGVKTNWTDSDELAMMFSGTFNSAYYKRLHRYVHKVYRQAQGRENLKQLFWQPWKANKSQIRSAFLTFYYFPTSIIDGYRLKKLELTN